MYNNSQNQSQNISIQITQHPPIKLTNSPFGNPNWNIKPKFYKLLAETFTGHSNIILNYWSISDWCHIRAINKMFLSVVHEYYLQRLKLEIQIITSYQSYNQDKSSIFMKNIDSQIPISSKNWLNFDLNSVTQEIQSWNRDTVTKLRAIKSLGKFSDLIYAPFCIIFGCNKSTNPKIKSWGWKKAAGTILSDSNFFLKYSKLDWENLNDNDILEAFVFLNLPELDLDNINRYSLALGKMIRWCQAVVSYHILIHPYVYRNENSQIKIGGDVYEFANNMSSMINRFYWFKRFWFKIGIAKLPLGDYVFNWQHSREIPQEDIMMGTYITEENIGTILSYLPLGQRGKFLMVNKKFCDGYKISLEKGALDTLKEIFYFKLQAYEKISRRVPIIYENNIFSKYFVMIDDIWNSECDCNEQGTNYVPFWSKEQLNDLKNIKIETDYVNSICKVLCVLLNEKVERKQNEHGGIKQLFMQRVKVLAINGMLLRLMRGFNKWDLNPKQIKVLSEEMNSFLNSEQLENDEYEMINYYINIINFLQQSLKVKYHFSGFALSSPVNAPVYNFKEMLERLREYLASQNITSEWIFETNSPDQGKIANVYFESKDLIPQAAKPALYERIMFEIISNSMNGSSGYQTSTGNNTSKENTDSNWRTINEESTGVNNNHYNKINMSPVNLMNQSISNTWTNNQMVSQGSRQEFHWNAMPNEWIISTLLWYLDIQTLTRVSLVSKKMNACIKTHIFLRWYYWDKEKAFIEEEKAGVINGIEEKRNNFFREYEMSPPNKEHACAWISQITNDDIWELKQYFRKFNKTMETIAAPWVVWLGEKSKNKFNADGLKEISYFIPAQKIIFKRDFIKKIQNFEWETIKRNVFTKVEKLMQASEFGEEKLRNLSPSWSHLVMWWMGVVEFNRVVRKYSLSFYDYSILDPEEINFCEQMDSILLLYYNMLRYSTKYCKKYKQAAMNIISSLNLAEETN